MNNQVKLIDQLKNLMDVAMKCGQEAQDAESDRLTAYFTGRASAFEEMISIIDTPPVPTIGCSECDYKGYFEYETGVVDEGTQIKEIAKEPCDCVIDPVPTIKPGDKVRHLGIQLSGEFEVDHLKTHTFGTYAALKHDGGIYTVPLHSLEVVE